MLEHDLQKAVFTWANLAKNTMPELALMFAIPNESYGNSPRDICRGAKFKAEGRKAGVPDVLLPVARGEYHGLFVEFKSKTGTVSPKQKLWLEALSKQGYLTVVLNDFNKTTELITNYINQ